MTASFWPNQGYIQEVMKSLNISIKQITEMKFIQIKIVKYNCSKIDSNKAKQLFSSNLSHCIGLVCGIKQSWSVHEIIDGTGEGSEPATTVHSGHWSGPESK